MYLTVAAEVSFFLFKRRTSLAVLSLSCYFTNDTHFYVNTSQGFLRSGSQNYFGEFFTEFNPGFHHFQ